MECVKLPIIVIAKEFKIISYKETLFYKEK